MLNYSKSDIGRSVQSLPCRLARCCSKLNFEVDLSLAKCQLLA